MGLQSSDTGYRCRVVTDSLPSFCRVKMLRFISVLVLIFTIGVGQMWADYTVGFATSGSDKIASGSEYVASSSTSGYTNIESSGLRFSSGSNSGSITVNLTSSGSSIGQIKASKITLKDVVRYGSDASVTVKYTINYTKGDPTTDTYTAPTSATDKDIDLDATRTIASVKIESTTGGKRFYCKGFTVTAAKTVSSIAVKTAPTKLAYLEGENFAPANLVITATYDNSTTEDITYADHESDFTFSPTTSASLTTSNTAVTITYATKTANQSINVYSVTVQVVDEDGTPLSGVGMPSASATGRNITASAKGNNYVFKTWEFVGSNNGLTISSPTSNETSLTGTPTGNVTIKAVYHKPIVVTWKVNGKAWTPSAKSGVDGTAEVGYGEQVSTLPTDPTTAEFCGQKFMGWTKTEIGSTGLTDADEISALNLFTTAGSSPAITTETTFHAVFADYGEE